jgi:uncharacterized protein (DUF924 family)
MANSPGPRVNAVLSFWFGPNPASARAQWFKTDPAFDRAITMLFGPDYDQARAGKLSAWEDRPEAALALTIMLDQFPRNMFRGTARAFESDALALQVAEKAIARGYDRHVTRVQRAFFYLPFEHSENIAHQERSLALFGALDDARSADYAEQHAAIIRRFGRFPHRNAVLGRQSTPEEIAYLKETPPSFA